MSSKTVEPGTPLASSEEALPGRGTYDDDGQIRAATFGEAQVQDYEAKVSSARPGVPSYERGDIVIGEIGYMRDDLASVKILAVRGKEGQMLQTVDATLRVAKVQEGYLNQMSEAFQCGDLIRAKIIGVRGGPQLATDSDDLGVVKAFSKDDLTRALVQDGKRLKDPVTGHFEDRKLARDYGSGQI